MNLTRVRAFALALMIGCAPIQATAQTQPAPTAKQASSTIPRDTTPTSIFVAPSGGGYGPDRVVALDHGLPVDCLSGCSSPVAFTPSGAASLSVSGTSSRVALPTGANLLLFNNGFADLYFKLGGNSVTAATIDYLLGSGRALVVAAGSDTYIAAITSTGTTTLSVTSGTGSPVISGGGGGGGGGGGAVTIADGADVTLGAKADDAWSGTGDGTVTANLGTIGGAAMAAKQPALGTLGTPSTDVLTVQGGTGMVPIIVQGTAAHDAAARVRTQ
ncbi:MAG: hypothetical protein GC203_02745 [Phenylobacterium sp.]|uniref:hypothetical protein n=1 Tax=Phenylobacterium sp. TaxID=1871053 RepID=UPI0025D3E461|nr:hypothetical protein [Phenylobacterium sp.]MBI1196759.1 hypothetical protein [Phenylobacterium sp.]